LEPTYQVRFLKAKVFLRRDEIREVEENSVQQKLFDEASMYNAALM